MTRSRVPFTVPEDDVKKILNQSTIKTCELGLLPPTSLLTHCLDDLPSHLTSITNESLHSGLFLICFQISDREASPQENNSIPRSWKNYRPLLSNLSFLYKILEKMFSASSRTICWPTIYSIFISILKSQQSAYRVSDLYALDQDKVSHLSLLDLSAAFDTIDHSILLSRISYCFSICDPVFVWFTSRLPNCVNDSKYLPLRRSLRAHPLFFSALNPFLR